MDPVLTVVPPTGQGVHPTESPTHDLKVLSAQAEQVPLLPLPEKPARQIYFWPLPSSSVLAGAVQLSALRAPWNRVVAPAGQLVQPRASPLLPLKVPAPQAVHTPPDP